MKFPAIGIFIAVLATSAAYARIGESLEQCAARYGVPIEKVKPGEKVVFVKEEFCIEVEFYKGKADKLLFVKVSGRKGARSPIPMSENELMILLKANGGGRKWSKVGENSSRTLWMSDDAQMMADRNRITGELMISTKANTDRVIAGMKGEAEKKLKGF